MKIAYLLAAGLSISLFLWYTAAADNKPVVFTNEDLAKQSSPERKASADNKPSKKTVAKKRSLHNKTSDNKEKEKWCKKSRRYKNRVDEAKASLQYAEAKHSEEISSTLNSRKGRRKAPSSDLKAKKARLKLKQAETALYDLEQEAHRNNIPPGWLRCQFSY